MSDFRTGGVVMGPPVRIVVVPPLPFSCGDRHDLILNHDYEVIGGIVWHEDGTTSLGEKI